MEDKKKRSAVEELAEKAGVSTALIYYYAKKAGRLPTLEELKGRAHTSPGRPPKYKSEV